MASLYQGEMPHTVVKAWEKKERVSGIVFHIFIFLLHEEKRGKKDPEDKLISPEVEQEHCILELIVHE